MKTIHTYPDNKRQAFSFVPFPINRDKLRLRAFTLAMLTAFAFIIACSDELPYDPTPQPTPPPVGEFDTYITVKGLGVPAATFNFGTGTRALSDMDDLPIVRAMRIIVFHGIADDAPVVTNNAVFRALGADTPIPVVESGGVWQISDFNFVLPTAASPAVPGKSTVWVIVNETDWTISVEGKGVISLSNALADVKTVGEMKALALNSAVRYEGTIHGVLHSNSERPAWPMANYKQIALPVEFDSKPTSLLNPYIVDFSGSADRLSRPMAKVTLQGMTNDHTSDVPGFDEGEFRKETAFIYITEIGVRNMARWFKWGPVEKLEPGVEKLKYNSSNFFEINTGSFPFDEETFFDNSVKFPGGYFRRSWVGEGGFFDLQLTGDETGGTIFEHITPTMTRVYYTGGSTPFSTDVYALDANISFWSGTNRWSIDQMPNKKWFATVTTDNSSWYETKSLAPPVLPDPDPLPGEGSLAQFKALVTQMIEGKDKNNPLKNAYRREDGSVSPPDVKGGVWRLTDAPVSLFVPEYIIDTDINTPPTELFITAARARMPQPGDLVVGELTENETIFDDVLFGDIMIRTKHRGEIKLEELTEADLQEMWGYITGSIQLPHMLGRHSIIRHYWDVDVYRVRSKALEIGEKVTVGNIQFTGANLDPERYTATIPISDGKGRDGTATNDYNIYRNLHYQFELVVTASLPSETRSSGGSGWGFSLRRKR